jgi:hypothetical protein
MVTYADIYYLIRLVLPKLPEKREQETGGEGGREGGKEKTHRLAFQNKRS